MFISAKRAAATRSVSASLSRSTGTSRKVALTRFINELERNPEIAKGYALFIYPICNPTGFEDNTRHARSGKDLNREFWTSSTQPEIRYLESEIWTHAFDGIITLHSDDTSDGLYAFVSGAEPPRT